MADAPAVLVTRPAGQADALLALLDSAGYRGVHCPMLAIEASEPNASARRLLLQLDQYQAVIFISGNAIRHGMRLIEDAWPQLPVGVDWYTVGEASAELLGGFGVTPLFPEEMTSEGLLALPGLREVAGRRVLIVKGEGGRQALRANLLKRGARVDELSAYRRQPVAMPAHALAQLVEAQRCRAVLVSSGEGLDNMVSLLEEDERAALLAIPLIVPGQRVAQLAESHGFQRVIAAQAATDKAMLAALRRCVDPGEMA